MVSHRAINDIMQTPKKEVHFFFFSVCCIVFNCSWQLIMFDKKQKSCVKRIHLVTDDGLYDRRAFYTVKIVFYSSSNDLFFYVLHLSALKMGPGLVATKKSIISFKFRLLLWNMNKILWKESFLSLIMEFFSSSVIVQMIR